MAYLMKNNFLFKKGLIMTCSICNEPITKEFPGTTIEETDYHEDGSIHRIRVTFVHEFCINFKEPQK
jgi:hypothetical protein